MKIDKKKRKPEKAGAQVCRMSDCDKVRKETKKRKGEKNAPPRQHNNGYVRKNALLSFVLSQTDWSELFEIHERNCRKHPEKSISLAFTARQIFQRGMMGFLSSVKNQSVK